MSVLRKKFAKETVFWGLLAALFILGNQGLFAQPKQTEPPYVDLFKYMNAYLYKREMNVWGWSRDGKVAYTEKRKNEYRGETIKTVYIFDSVKDSVLWTKEITDYDYKEKTEKEYNTAYSLFFNDFRAICDRYKIVLKQPEFEPMPIEYNGKTINIWVDYSPKELIFSNTIESYTIFAETGGKIKILKANTKALAYEVYPCGYFMSPYEKRALIVLVEFGHGWEGDTDIRFTLAGCHLETGFK
jgi:hypothetical protein